MKKRLPSAYQLCRIAAALQRPGSRITKPAGELVKDAMALWLVAVDELAGREMVEHEGGNVASSSGRSISSSPDDLVTVHDPVWWNSVHERIAKSADEVSAKAMDWVNAKATSQDDHFKTLGRFKKAYETYADDQGLPRTISDDPADWSSFLQFRAEKRRSKERTGKRAKRKKEASQRKSAPDTRLKAAGKRSKR